MNLQPVWKDVFACNNEISLKAYFDRLGQEFYSLYCSLQSKDPIEFSLTAEQKVTFNAFFARMQDKYLVLQGVETTPVFAAWG